MKPRRLNAFGQEAAPFEVLISVVIMGFVIVVALAALQAQEREQCKLEINSAGVLLKNKIEEVVKGNDTSLDFFPPSCFDSKTEVIKLQKISNESLCSFYCGGTRLECMVFIYESSGHTERVCLQAASVLTQFVTDTTCPAQEGYQPINFLDRISRGHYNLINISRSIDAFPKICAYRSTSIYGR